MATELFCRVSSKGKLLSANSAFEQLVGLEADDVRGKALELWVREDDRDDFRQEVSHCMNGLREIVLSMIGPKQMAYTVEWKLFGRGEDVLMVGRKCRRGEVAERVAQENGERLEAALEGLLDGVCAMGRDWRITFCNRRFAGLMDAEVEALIGCRLWDLWPSLANSRLRDWLRAALEGAQESSLQERLKASGQWVEFHATPTAEGLVLYARNISVRKESESRMRLLDTCLAHVNDMVMVTRLQASDSDQQILYVNQAFARRSGYSLREILGRTPRLLEGPKTDQAEISRLQEAIEAARPVRSELIQYTKSGAPFWVEVDLSPVFDRAGECSHFVAILREVTKRKARDNELAQARIAAEAANIAKAEFLSLMSHEMRTPLNPILGFTDLLLETALDEEQRECVESIRNSARHLSTLVSDILDFTLVEEDKPELESQAFTIGDLVASVENLISVEAEERGLSFEVNLGGMEERLFLGDHRRLHQVLFSLVANAVKFTPSGKVEVSVTSVVEHGTVHRLGIEVKDTGVGIPPDLYEQIFEPFFQVEAGAARAYEGAGLGLAIAKRTAEAMNGKITVSSREGGGSIFRVELELPEVGGPIPEKASDRGTAA